MKKVIIGLSIALLAFGAMGCHKEKKVKAASAAAAAPAAEQLLSVEVFGQLSDPSDGSLTCKYVVVSGNSISSAEAKMPGQCDFGALKGSVAPSGSLSAAAAASIVSIVASDSSLPANARDKWDCKAINVKTNVRQAGAQDCADGSGINDATGKALAAALGL